MLHSQRCTLTNALPQAVGFDQPILHGLCTFAIACRAVMQLHGNSSTACVKKFSARFAAPMYVVLFPRCLFVTICPTPSFCNTLHMYPGETLRVETWRSRGSHSDIIVRATALDRSKVVLSNAVLVLNDQRERSKL